MTGTADTEAVEFQAIYSLETVVIPPNKSSARDDMTDQIYLTLDENLEANNIMVVFVKQHMGTQC
jgi:preprotein translocase subunit SecA